MHDYLEFEKPVADLEGRIEELRHIAGDDATNVADEVQKLQGRVTKLLEESYGKLTPWQKTQVARHPDRPHALDYIGGLIEDFTPLAGDRISGEDPAVVGGLGRFQGASVVVIGHEKGGDPAARARHNFGMPRPEGYRKAARLMRLAERFGLPVLTFVDTPGIHTGGEADTRGAAEAVGRAIETALSLRVPVVGTVIGEGDGAGALALLVADRILMVEHAVLSAASPETAATFLWDDGSKTTEAAEALRLTAHELEALGVVDTVIAEPLGGAHRFRDATVAAVGKAIETALEDLSETDGGQLRARRRDKFLEMGRQAV